MTIVGDLDLDTVFTKGMTTSRKDPGESFLRIVDAADGT
jgi:hypothetical protein